MSCGRKFNPLSETLESKIVDEQETTRDSSFKRVIALLERTIDLAVDNHVEVNKSIETLRNESREHRQAFIDLHDRLTPFEEDKKAVEALLKARAEKKAERLWKVLPPLIVSGVIAAIAFFVDWVKNHIR